MTLHSDSSFESFLIQALKIHHFTSHLTESYKSWIPLASSPVATNEQGINRFLGFLEMYSIIENVFSIKNVSFWVISVTIPSSRSKWVSLIKFNYFPKSLWWLLQMHVGVFGLRRCGWTVTLTGHWARIWPNLWNAAVFIHDYSW